jgi:uncharacterized membrane protein
MADSALSTVVHVLFGFWLALIVPGRGGSTMTCALRGTSNTILDPVGTKKTRDYLNSAFHREMNGPFMKFGRAVLGDFLVDIACDG